MTEGVLLLTTDGEAAHRLTHPSTGVERSYVATVRGSVKAAAAQIRAGVELEDGLVVPERVEVKPSAEARAWDLSLTIREGRTREIRRLCDAVGLEVLRLVRTSFGPVKLGALAPGASRPLTERERDLLQALTQSGTH
jgi:23S rRNA pseudouridine2605 synthase